MTPKPFVVDASVAVKWFLPEIHAEAASRVLSGGHNLLVPDLVFPEVGNILWKRVRAGEVTPEEAEVVMQTLGALPLAVHPSWPLVLPALEIAVQTQRTVYDSLYLALAVREDAALVTADERLYNALQGTPLAAHLRWVATF